MVNENKKYEINTSTGWYGRDAIPTHFVQIGEDYVELVERYVKPLYNEGDILSISEKVISLCQNRVVHKKDMKLTRLAKFLSKFASHSDAGIGVDSVWKMQYAIDHCGRWKVIWASICAGFGKIFGKRGVFYEMVGDDVRGLDGFYDHSFAVYGEFGIELPAEPDKVCDEIYEKTGVLTMVVDANDFTRDILGKSHAVNFTDEQLAEMIRDNPAGQSAQCTPFVLIKKIDAPAEA